MKPILVHLHVYYDFLYPELKQCLKNIAAVTDIKVFATLSSDKPEIKKDIEESFKDANVQLVANVGYDIAPFITVLDQVNLDDYSYVIKLHTKRDIPASGSLFWFKGPNWRNMLLRFAITKDNFTKVLTDMENDSTIGMNGPVASTFNFITDDKVGHKESNKFIKEKGFKLCSYRFVAGTMFMVRAHLLKQLKAMNLKTSDFDRPNETHEDCQLAHKIERLLGYLVYANGYRICDCTVSKFKEKLISFCLSAMSILHIVTDPFISIRITKKNKLLIKVIKIPVFAYRLKNKPESKFGS